MQSVSTLSPTRPISERASSYFEQVRAQFLETVRDLEVGARVPPERELAQTLGASTLMVGRVLQELQREGLVQRIPGKGTFLSGGTPSLPTPEEQPRPVTNVAQTAIFARLGLEPNQALINQDWGPVAVSRLERTLQQAGGKTFVVNLQTRADDEIAAMMAQLSGFGANSAVLIGDINQASLGHNWMRALQAWQETATPALVHLSLDTLGHSCDTVSYDGAWGSTVAARHLRELGHTSVAYMVPELMADIFDFTIERFAALERAFLTAPDANVKLVRVPFALEGEDRDLWRAAGAIAAQSFADDFSAVMLANDFMAQGFMAHLRAAGRELPAAVVGYDDILNSSALGLTTVHVPIEAMAKQAAALLERRLQQPTETSWTNVALKPQLVVRSSTRAPKSGAII